jgi:translation initiation factor IF-3
LFGGPESIAAERKNRVNDEIEASSVRLIGVEGSQLGIMSLQEALGAAEEAGLDLVELSPNADPPVCRLIDYGKYLFQQNKKRQAARKKQHQTKLRSLRRFLQHGDKTKVTLWFRGREMRHQELGLKLLQRVEGDLEDLAKVEQFPKLEGRRLSMVLSPRK